MIVFTYRHATHLNFSHSVSVSVSAVLFLSDRWQCCSSTENHLATLDGLVFLMQTFSLSNCSI